MLWFRTLSNLIAFFLSIIWHSKFLSNTLVFFIRSTVICSRGKNFLASLQTSTWLFVFPKEPIGLTCQSPLTVILYDLRSASANRNSSMGVMMSKISGAPVGVPGKADEIIRKASQRWNRSGFSRPDPTGKFQNSSPVNRFLTGPVDQYFYRRFLFTVRCV